jgi:hypothetical protein
MKNDGIHSPIFRYYLKLKLFFLRILPGLEERKSRPSKEFYCFFCVAGISFGSNAQQRLTGGTPLLEAGPGLWLAGMNAPDNDCARLGDNFRQSAGKKRAPEPVCFSKQISVVTSLCSSDKSRCPATKDLLR